LQRIANIYEWVYQELPKDRAGEKLWPREAVERLAAAHRLVRAKRVLNIKEALLATKRGVQGGRPQAKAAPAPPSQAAIRSVEEMLKVVLAELQALKAEMAELRAQTAALQRDLAGSAMRTVDLQEVIQRVNKLDEELERRDADAKTSELRNTHDKRRQKKVRRPGWFR
jgi:predicted RNase H-like nuclease (RuvC/YqgF family)